MKQLNPDQIEELKQFDTPTVSNAIESFKVRPKTKGFTGPQIKCMLPDITPIVGYACTVKISSLVPPTQEQKELVFSYYESLQMSPKPSVSVVQDLDPQPTGSFWGEVNATIHKSLGCTGAITNGGVRDIEEVKKIGFRYFAKNILVSHAYAHLTEFGSPVKVGGLIIETGDLLHADINGIVSIPHRIAPKLAQACREVQKAENIIISECKKRIGKGIDIRHLQELRKKMYEIRDRNRA